MMQANIRHSIFLSKFTGNLKEIYTMYIYIIYLKKIHCNTLYAACTITGNLFFCNKKKRLINNAVRTVIAFGGCSEH